MASCGDYQTHNIIPLIQKKMTSFSDENDMKGVQCNKLVQHPCISRGRTESLFYVALRPLYPVARIVHGISLRDLRDRRAGRDPPLKFWQRVILWEDTEGSLKRQNQYWVQMLLLVHTTVCLPIASRSRNQDVNVSTGRFASETRMSRSLTFGREIVPPITAHYFNEEVRIDLQGWIALVVIMWSQKNKISPIFLMTSKMTLASSLGIRLLISNEELSELSNVEERQITIIVEQTDLLDRTQLYAAFTFA